MFVRKVRIEGLERTKEDVIEHELQEAYNASTLEGVAVALHKASQELHSLGIFKTVHITMDAERGCPADEVDVKVEVEERGVLRMKAGTFVENGEGGVEASGSLRNVFGGAETIEGSALFGTALSSNKGISLMKPRFLGLPAWLNLSAAHRVDNWERFSAISVDSASVRAAVSSYDKVHSVSCESSWRDVVPRMCALEGETAEGIRTGSGLAAGHRTAASDQILHPGNHGNSLKTSVAYTCSRDGRDHPLVPTEGSLFRATGEVAGLVGDVSFLKGEMGRDWRGDSGLERRREDVRYKKKAHLRWDMVEMWLKCVWCVCL